jgi:WD40 repeat protein
MFMNRITYVSILLFFAAVSGIFSQRILPSPPPPPPFPEPPPPSNTVLNPQDMIISSDSKRIAVDYFPYTIVWDIKTRKILGRAIESISNSRKNPWAFNQDGSIRAEGSEGVLSLFNTENNRLIQQVGLYKYEKFPFQPGPNGVIPMIYWPPPEEIEKIYFTPDSKNIIVISTVNGKSRIWSVDLMGTVSLVNTWASLPEYVRVLDLNIFQGKAVVSGNSGVIIVNLFSKRKEGEIPLNDNNMVLETISFSLNDNKNKNSVLLVSDRNDESYLYICDMEGQKIINRRKINGSAYMVRLTGEENIVALASPGSVCLYNYQTGTEIVSLIAEKPMAEIPPVPPGSVFEPMRERTFQVGSFSSFADASHLMNDIRRDGFHPYLERSRQNNSPVWRVLIYVRDSEITSMYRLLQNIGYTNILMLN